MLKLWIRASRVNFAAASVLPAMVGGLVAWYETGHFNVFVFFATVLGSAMLHLAANFFNDYHDHQSGADAANKEGFYPISGGSRVIQAGEVTPKGIRNAAWLMVAGGALIGLVLALRVGGWGVYALVLFGVLSGYLYVHPKFSLMNKGLGEILVGLNFGVVISAGAYYVQTGEFSVSAFTSGLPLSLGLAALLVINEFPDYSGDKAARKITAVVRLGREKASVLLTVLLLLTSASVVLNVAAGWTNFWNLTALLALPFAFSAIGSVRQHFNTLDKLFPTNIAVINFHLFTGIWQVVGCMAGRSFPVTVVSWVLMAAVLLFQFKTMRQLGMLPAGKAADASGR